MPVTNYIWDPETDALVMETDGDGNTTAVYTQEPKPYGGLISQRRGGVTSYYQQDALGSTRQLTNDSEAVTDSYTYSAYGQTVAASGSTVNPFRWIGGVGYYFDEVSGSHYIRNRTFESATGRWKSLDPAFLLALTEWPTTPRSPTSAARELHTLASSRDSTGIVASNPTETPTRLQHAYVYCSSSPIVQLDPSGLWELRCRFLTGWGALTRQYHCWLECDGHSYSLLNDDGESNLYIDDPRDKGLGTVVQSAPGRCDCISRQFAALPRRTYPYSANDCNSIILPMSWAAAVA